MKTDEDEEIFLREPLDRLNDAYFKFALASPERKNFTIGFLNAVLNHRPVNGEVPVKIEDVEFIDRETVQEANFLKGARFDVLARSVDGRRFHIEVQNARENFFMQRSFYYAASSYVTQLKRGVKYDKLEPIVFIGLMNFRLFGDYSKPEEWYSLHRFMNAATHEHVLKEIEFHMVELPLFKRYIERMNAKPKGNFEDFICYFGKIGGDELLDEIAERNTMIRDLRVLESIFTQNPAALRQYLNYQRDKADYFIALEEEKNEGIREGIRESNLENARNLRKQGILTNEQIAQALNLPLETVAAL